MGFNFKSITLFNVKEWHKWLFIFLSYIVIEISNYYEKKMWFFFHFLVVAIFFLFIISTVFFTKIGKYIIYLLIESKKEIKNIIFPTIQETLYTSLVVIMITILISLVIYGIDKTFFYLISCIIKLGF